MVYGQQVVVGCRIFDASKHVHHTHTHTQTLSPYLPLQAELEAVQSAQLAARVEADRARGDVAALMAAQEAKARDLEAWAVREEAQLRQARVKVEQDEIRWPGRGH